MRSETSIQKQEQLHKELRTRTVRSTPPPTNFVQQESSNTVSYATVKQELDQIMDLKHQQAIGDNSETRGDQENGKK